ncbi:MraY family glycosyltransferase [Nonlabens sp.]|uniref:MraY family glycosyltransferase n=1 Tax=Nonlabens sp. TaxID=1888209 RepID=UPI001BCC68E4|nr:MraY family glycosyltransferase [Nonlabens sp.]
MNGSKDLRFLTLDSVTVYVEVILQNYPLFLLGSALLAFFINHYLSKKVLLIALKKRLFAQQSLRSSHRHPTPALGGIPIFVVVMTSMLLAIGVGFSSTIGFTLASCFILFLTGLKDDLVGASARSKFLAQLLAAILFVVNPDFALDHLSEFLGIGLMDSIWTYVIGMVFIVSLVNAFNLIDGIDGLAGMTAIVSFSVFGVYFYLNDHYEYTIFCATLIGALASFLTFNFALPGKKMFLGDTGALVVGFLLAAFALRILELQPLEGFVGFYPKNAPLFILSVLIIPVLDTARIIVIRLSNGQKPWYADRSHMHHVLLDVGYSHKEATFRLITLQLVAILGYIVVEGAGQVALHFYVLALYGSVIALFVGLRAKVGAKDGAHPAINA